MSSANITAKGKQNIIRKHLGCRRSLQHMPAPEDHQLAINGDDIQQDDLLGRKKLSSRPSNGLRNFKRQKHLIFTSPRVNSSDQDLFPCNHSLYKNSNDRWLQISAQAGRHRQDGTVMNIGRRPSTAMAFRTGIIGCAAVRVRSLNLWLDHQKDTLNLWLEMIRDVFVNLEHLTLTEDIFPGEDDMAVSARMRRLYVLSILPNLKSIDDMVVTTKEREMANPRSCSDQFEIDQDKLQSPSSKSITDNIDQILDSRTTVISMSVENDSIRSSRGIEVEYLAAKFQDLQHIGIETNVSGDPTAFSESTTIMSFTDDDSVFENQDTFRGAAFLNDVTTVPQVHLFDGESNDSVSIRNKNHTHAQVTEKCLPPKDQTFYSMHRFNNAAIEATSERTTNHHFQSPFRIALSNHDNSYIDDSLKKKNARIRVRAFDTDSNNGVELVSVSSTDLEWSIECGILNLRKTKLLSPGILPSSEDMKTMKRTSHVNINACQQSMPSLWEKEREKENSNREAYAPKACTPVQRQSGVSAVTSKTECAQLLKNELHSASKFLFPISERHIRFNLEEKVSDFCSTANQKPAPSRSLSSPFPLQFQERQLPSSSIRSTRQAMKSPDSMVSGCPREHLKGDNFTENKTETFASPLSVIASQISSPNIVDRESKSPQKGNFSPPLPSGLVPRKTSSSHKFQKRKSNRRDQILLKENARYTSVIDLCDEEEFLDACIGD